jgi:hypothetical protein
VSVVGDDFNDVRLLLRPVFRELAEMGVKADVVGPGAQAQVLLHLIWSGAGREQVGPRGKYLKLSVLMLFRYSQSSTLSRD